MTHSALSALADFLLTRDERRGPLLLWLISAITYLLYSALVGLQVLLGFTTPAAGAGVVVAMVAINVFFHFGVRFGWGPLGDRRLGITQLMVGVVFMWVGYSIAGPASGAMLVIVATHVVYAVFTLTSRRVWQLVIGSLAGLALTMVLCHWWQPARYDAGTQLIGLLYTTLVMVLIARLAALVAKMQARMRTQQQRLADALEQVGRLATRDDLTQVHNRRHLLELMAVEHAKHARHGAPLCVALLDLDFFKVVNDTHGHPIGDQVLQRFAEQAQALMRTGDLLGRWGGEEFLVMFPDTPVAQAQAVLQRIREALDRLDLGDLASGLGITFSAGLVQLEPDEALQHAIERADQAMYLAKQGGRDRTEVAAAPARRQA